MIKRERGTPFVKSTEPENTGPQATYTPEHEPIVISHLTLSLILNKTASPADTIALYNFYYYTAKWQRTNRVRCTTGFAATGLGISKKRVASAKKDLATLGLIEDVVTKGPGGKIAGNYVQVNFLFTSSTTAAMKLQEEGLTGATVSHTPVDDVTGATVYRSTEERCGNALRDVSINALRESTEKENISRPRTEYVERFLSAQKERHGKKVQINNGRITRSVTMLQRLQRLDNFDFEKEIKPVLDWAQTDDFWSPNLLSLGSLRKVSNSNDNIKFVNIMIAYERRNEEGKPTGGNGSGARISEDALRLGEIFYKRGIGGTLFTKNGAPKKPWSRAALEDLLKLHRGIRYPHGPRVNGITQRIKREIGSPELLARRFCDWIDGGTFKNPETICPEPDGKLFRQFAAELVEDYGGAQIFPKWDG